MICNDNLVGACSVAPSCTHVRSTTHSGTHALMLYMGNSSSEKPRSTPPALLSTQPLCTEGRAAFQHSMSTALSTHHLIPITEVQRSWDSLHTALIDTSRIHFAPLAQTQAAPHLSLHHAACRSESTSVASLAIQQHHRGQGFEHSSQQSLLEGCCC